MIRCNLLLLAFVMAGCRSMPAAKPVTLPTASAISAIEVTPNFGDSRPTAVISDSKQIERFVMFVNSRSSGWKLPQTTFPAGTYTVAAKRGDETLAVFWPAPGFIGGREGGKGADANRLLLLAEEDSQELAGILDVGDFNRP